MLKTIIYKITCKDETIKECYIGQTSNFIKRMNTHKNACKNINHHNYKYKLYSFIRNHLGWENWNMIEIEKFEHNYILEARNREKYYINLYGTLNKQIPTRTVKEYYQVNKEKFKKYYQVNKEKRKEYIINKNKKI